MKNLLLVMLLFVTIGATAQKSLFDNISTTDSYDEYWDVQSKEDGTCFIREKRFIVKFETDYLPSGEGIAIKAVVSEGDKKGHVVEGSNVVENYNMCKGYPYESVLSHKYNKTAFVAIGDYVFVINGVSEDGTSFKWFDHVFIKRATTTTTNAAGETKEEPKKKKISFKDIANAVKDNYTGGTSSVNYGEAHKELEGKDLKKMVTDYLVAMKAKQDGRSSSEKQKDKNVTDAKALYDSDVDAYNDKIKASPEYKKMKAHQKAMEEMENGSSSSSSTSSSKTVEVYVDPNGKGTVKIYWKQNGSNKTFTLTGSRRKIGDIPEGTQLSYSVGPSHNKKQTFYSVPSGKSSVSVDL